MDRQKRSLSLLLKIRGVAVYGAILISTICFGVVCLLTGIFSLKAARYVALTWNFNLLWIAGIKLKVSGLEKLQKNKRYVFIANHQSGLDIPVLYAGLNRLISFIAKKELFYIPIFGWGMVVVGHIWIDRSNARKARDSIMRAVKHLQKAQVSLILFPEGTRSADGSIGEFKKGSFSLALQAGVEVVPVAIHDTMKSLPKNSLLITPGTIHVDVCDPIDVSADETKSDMSVKIRNIICDVIARGPKE
ncbi:MAG: lysophospholipid acyltransferase family protein [Fibrobacterota bacterium]|nr:lysophospholipid acyltransferase family protein [Chitinispirillaceae bacterium]